MSDSEFTAAVAQLQAVQVGIESGGYDTNLYPSIADRHAVLARFQPIFALEPAVSDLAK